MYSAEEHIWGLMRSALADARTRATPDDPQVADYWRGRIRAALAPRPRPERAPVLCEDPDCPLDACYDACPECGWHPPYCGCV